MPMHPIVSDIGPFAYPIFGTAITFVVFIKLGMAVGKARKTHKVMPPKMTGPPLFERISRVFGNQVEQHSLHLAGLWLFSLFVDPRIGMGLSVLWNVLRLGYSREYVSNGYSIAVIMYTAPCYLINAVLVLGPAGFALREML